MKIPCEIIRDLIPMMEDEVCSEVSKKEVLAHIAECEECRKLSEALQKQLEFVLNAEEKAEKQAVGRGFKKVKKRWLFSTLAVLLLFPVLYLSWGQYQGRGVSFTNIHELMIAEAFLDDLEQGNYEEAFEHWNLNYLQDRWQKEWFEEDKLDNLKEDAVRVFYESAALLKNVGGMKNSKFFAIAEGVGYYSVYYTTVVNGKEEQLRLHVTDKGVINMGGEGSYIDDPIEHFAAWSEYLWQEYEGCYFDVETKQYIYPEG